MPSLPLDIVDVFAEAPLEGNQLAIVHNAANLSAARMQDIAREMNFSETTFVLSHSAQRARVRIFTPGGELPFAGHPTIGTAWVLGRDQGSYILDLQAGSVTVTFAEDGVCWMAPPMPELTGTLAPKDAATLLNLSTNDLAPEYLPTLMRIGPEFAIIGVRDSSVLGNVNLNPEVRSRLLDAGVPVGSVFVFCESAGDEASPDYVARMFFDAGGLREDPATGSANSAFAIYLRDHCGNDRSRYLGRYVVAQGDYMHRPSRIYLDIRADSYHVGGRVVSVVRGELAAG